jgi:hypothetical protein
LLLLKRPGPVGVAICYYREDFSRTRAGCGQCRPTFLAFPHLVKTYFLGKLHYASPSPITTGRRILALNVPRSISLHDQMTWFVRRSPSLNCRAGRHDRSNIKLRRSDIFDRSRIAPLSTNVSHFYDGHALAGAKIVSDQPGTNYGKFANAFWNDAIIILGTALSLADDANPT